MHRLPQAAQLSGRPPFFCAFVPARQQQLDRSKEKERREEKKCRGRMALPVGGQGLAATAAIGENFRRRESPAHRAC